MISVLLVLFDLLVHPGKRFTSHTITTFEVCLVLGEVNGPSSQSSLLQNPSTLIQWSHDDVLVEAIDVLADVERLVRLEGDIFSLGSSTKETIALIAGAASSNHAVCSAVHVFHSARFVCTIAICTLDYTNGVNP